MVQITYALCELPWAGAFVAAIFPVLHVSHGVGFAAGLVWYSLSLAQNSDGTPLFLVHVSYMDGACEAVRTTMRANRTNVQRVRPRRSA